MHMTIAAISLVMLVWLVGHSSSDQVQIAEIPSPTKIDGSVLYPHHAFGQSLAMDGGTLAVGTSWQSISPGQGLAVVFDGPGMGVPLVSADESFGGRVALSEGVLVVGSNASLNTYRKTAAGWILEGVIPSQGFFSSYALEADILAVYHTGLPGPSPVVDVYEREDRPLPGWKLVATLTSPGPSFSPAVGVSGDWLVTASSRESVLVYQRGPDGAWSFHQELHSPQPGGGISFGGRVVIGGRVLVVSALQDGALGEGSVYVYRLNDGSWELEENLKPRPGERDEVFGASALLVRNRLFVGSIFATVRGVEDAGKVYEFVSDGGEWVLARVLHAPDFEAMRNFGIALAWAGDRLAVGSLLPDEGGAVYLYDYSN